MCKCIIIRRHHRGQQAVRASPVGPLLSPTLAKSTGREGGVPPQRKLGSVSLVAPAAHQNHWHDHFTTTTSQKAVSMGPRRSLGRPKLIFSGFGIDLGIILDFCFHQNFDIFRKWRKCKKSEEYNAKRASKPSKTFDFHIDFSSKVHAFSKRLPKRCFVRLLAAQGHHKVAVLIFSGGFGSPLGF